jgi:hypothetical protein
MTTGGNGGMSVEKIRELLDRGGRNALENDTKMELSNSADSFVGRETGAKSKKKN